MDISRRTIFASLAVAAMAFAIVEKPSEAIAGLLLGHSKPASDIVAPGPGPLWNGVSGSGYGGTPPVDAPRVTAKPILRFITPIHQRISTKLTIGVDGGALGDVAHVEFWAENPSSTVNANRIVYRDTDANGATRFRQGWFADIVAATFLAQVPGGGDIDVYCRATPNDGTMQPRTLGPWTFHIAATQNDTSVTLGQVGSGSDYLFLQVALDALNGSAQNPLISVISNGNYELQSSAATAYKTGKGYANIVAAPGINATFRVSSFPGSATSNYNIDPRYDRLHFVGSGITIDQTNFVFLSCSTQTNVVGGNHWLDGCNYVVQGVDGLGLTSPYCNYWNGGERPFGFLIGCAIDAVTGKPKGGPGYSGGGWFEEVTARNVCQGLCAAEMVRGCNLDFPIERFVNSSLYAAGNYMNKTGTGFFRNAPQALGFMYSGAAATATYTKTASSDTDWFVTGASIILNEAGVTFKLGLSIYPNQPNTATPNDGSNGIYHFMSDIKAFLDGDPTKKAMLSPSGTIDGATFAATHPGWSCDNRFITSPTTNPWTGAAYSINDRRATTLGGTNGTSAQNVKGVQYNEISFTDIHSGGYNVTGKLENFALLNNTCLNIDNPNRNGVGNATEGANFSIVLFDSSGSAQDGLIEGNTWQGGSTFRIKALCSPFSHVVMRNNSLTIQVRFEATTVSNFTASITADVLNVTAFGVGAAQNLAAGILIEATAMPNGTSIVSQLSGTTGGIGTYQLSSSGLTLGSRSMTSAAPFPADAYCAWIQGVTNGWSSSSGPLPPYPALIDSYNVGTPSNAPSTYTGNTYGVVTDAVYANLIGGLAGGGEKDTPPSPPGALSNLTAGTVLLAHLKTPVRPWDSTFTDTNPAGDVIGAYAKANTLMPARPF